MDPVLPACPTPLGPCPQQATPGSPSTPKSTQLRTKSVTILEIKPPVLGWVFQSDNL